MADESAERRIARVPARSAGSRLDRFLQEYFPHYSRRRLQAVIRAGEVRVDGRRARPGQVLAGGERLELPVLSRAVARADREARRRQQRRREAAASSEVVVLHRDEDLLIVSKPPGLAVHGGAGIGPQPTLLDVLKADVLAGFGLVHRLDRDTSGVVALVRDPDLRARTARLFADPHAEVLEKVYDALVDGVPEEEAGEIDLPLCPPGHGGRARVDLRTGRPARTRYRTTEAFPPLAARLRVELLSGRTHQIRAHFSAIGHPLLVDRTYGVRGGWRLVDPRGRLDARLRRTPLHASLLTLPHPRSGTAMTFRAPLAADVKYALEVLRVHAATRDGRRGRS